MIKVYSFTKTGNLLQRFFDKFESGGAVNYGFTRRSFEETPVWNPPEACERAVDKSITQRILEPLGLTPPSSGRGPFLMKPTRGSKGEGIYMTTRHASRPGYVCQKLVRTSHEYRVIVALGEVAEAMAKYPFRSNFNPLIRNLSHGWEWQLSACPQSVKDVAVDAAEALQLDICGVDIGVTGCGPKVFEVNSASWLDMDLAWKIARIFYVKLGEADKHSPILSDSPPLSRELGT